MGRTAGKNQAAAEAVVTICASGPVVFQCPKGADGLFEVLRMGVDRLLQQSFTDRQIVLFDRGQGKCVQQLRPFDLGHGDDGQIVVPLRATGQNKVVLGGEPLNA